MEFNPNIIIKDLCILKNKYGENKLTNIINEIDIDNPKIFRTCDKYDMRMEEYGICRLVKQSIITEMEGGGIGAYAKIVSKLVNKATKTLPGLVKNVSKVGQTTIKTITNNKDTIAKVVTEAGKITGATIKSIARKLKPVIDSTTNKLKNLSDDDKNNCIQYVLQQFKNTSTHEQIADEILSMLETNTHPKCKAITIIRNNILNSIKTELKIKNNPSEKILKIFFDLAKPLLKPVLVSIINSNSDTAESKPNTQSRPNTTNTPNQEPSQNTSRASQNLSTAGVYDATTPKKPMANTENVVNEGGNVVGGFTDDIDIVLANANSALETDDIDTVIAKAKKVLNN